MPPTLVYKRTHHGDPGESGHFGCRGCMGKVRGWCFEEVIGIGGIGSEPIRNGISGRVNWVGIGPHRVGWRRGGPILAFDHFHDYGTTGPFVRQFMPLLARRMYGVNVRVTMRFGPRTQEQIDAFLRQFLTYPPSPAGIMPSGSSTLCRGGIRRRRCPRQNASTDVRIRYCRPN